MQNSECRSTCCQLLKYFSRSYFQKMGCKSRTRKKTNIAFFSPREWRYSFFLVKFCARKFFKRAFGSYRSESTWLNECNNTSFVKITSVGFRWWYISISRNAFLDFIHRLVSNKLKIIRPKTKNTQKTKIPTIKQQTCVFVSLFRFVVLWLVLWFLWGF